MTETNVLMTFALLFGLFCLSVAFYLLLHLISRWRNRDTEEDENEYMHL